MSIKRALVDAITYTLDAPTVADRTFVTLPLSQLMSPGQVRPRETPVTTTDFNGAEVLAHVENRFALPFALDPNDVFLAPLIAASCALTPVWFRFLACGQSQGDEVGGSRGCQVAVTSGAIPEFGELGVSIVAGMATACCAGETMGTFTLGS